MKRTDVANRQVDASTRRQPNARARVLAPSGKPLHECALRRADEMVGRGRAAWVTTEPPTIKLTPKKS